MKALWILLVAAFPLQSFALEMLKCNTRTGKTLWATFGRVSHGEESTYYPIELTIFKSRTELQDRLYFDNTNDALAIKVDVTASTVAFRFPATNGDVSEQQWFKLSRAFYDDDRSYDGTWTVIKADGTAPTERVGCSVY